MVYLEMNLKKSGYMYPHNWFTLLYTWNQHNIVNQLHASKSQNKRKTSNFSPDFLCWNSLILIVNNWRNMQRSKHNRGLFLTHVIVLLGGQGALWTASFLPRRSGTCVHEALLQNHVHPRQPGKGKTVQVGNRPACITSTCFWLGRIVTWSHIPQRMLGSVVQQHIQGEEETLSPVHSPQGMLGSVVQ